MENLDILNSISNNLFKSDTTFSYLETLLFFPTTPAAFNISMLLTFSNFIFELEKKEVQILKERKWLI